MLLFLRLAARKRENIEHDIESILELFESEDIPKTVPIHWNFPVSPLFSETNEVPEVLRQIISRVKANKDVLIPMGYSGAYHGLLTDEELRKEIQWTSTNPWGKGFEDITDTPLPLMMPAQMDFLRPASRSYYNSLPFTWFVAPEMYSREGKGKRYFEKLEFLDHGNLYSFPLLCLNSSLDETGKLIRRFSKKEVSPLAVLLDFTNGNTREDLLFLYNAVVKLQQKIEIKFVKISKWLSPDGKQALANTHHHPITLPRVPGTMLPMVSLPHDPADRTDRTEAGKKRFFIRTNDIGGEAGPYINVINRVSSVYKRAEAVESRPRTQSNETPVERSLIADMPGRVILKEHAFEVEFYNGRLTNIIGTSGPFLAGLQSQSFITIENNRYEFENTGVYSFESEEIRGLREIMSLECPPCVNNGHLVIDHMFIGEHPSLFVSVDIRYPDFPGHLRVNSYAPLEIPLYRFTPEDELSAVGVYPDDTRYSIDIPCAENIYNLPGNEHQFIKNTTAFSMIVPPVEEQQIGTVSVSVKMTKQGGILSVNPRGSYVATNTQYISGYSEHFNLMISAGESGLRQTKVPPEVLEQLQHTWLGKL